MRLSGHLFFDCIIAIAELSGNLFTSESMQVVKRPFLCASACSIGQISCLILAPEAHASDNIRTNAVYEISELFELGIQLSYLLLLLGFLGIGTFFVLRQVLVRRELDLSAKELQVRLIFSQDECAVFHDEAIFYNVFHFTLPVCNQILTMSVFVYYF